MTNAEALADGFAYVLLDSAGKSVAFARTIKEANELQKSLKSSDECPVVELLKTGEHDKPPDDLVALLTVLFDVTKTPLQRHMSGAYLGAYYAMAGCGQTLRESGCDADYIAALRLRAVDLVRSAVRHLKAEATK